MCSDCVVVTGAAGFIGHHFLKRLRSRGHDAVAIDRRLGCDCNDLNAYRDALKGKRIGMVWHLASNSDVRAGMADPAIDFRDTFQSTFNTLLVMRERGIGRLAFTSSSAVFG